MKTPEEYTSKYKYYPTIPVEEVNSIIKEGTTITVSLPKDNITKKETIIEDSEMMETT